MSRAFLSPAVAGAWTLACCTGVVLFGSAKELGVLVLCYLVLVLLGTKSEAVIRNALVLTLPFAVPLTVVHGILNPNYAVSENVCGGIPLRLDGVAYALLISLRILIFSCAVMTWRFVDPDRLMREAVHLRLPRSLVVTLAVAMASMTMVHNRIGTVYLAQQARGLSSGPGLFARVRALPSVVVPVVVATLLEGSARGELMATRGLGTTGLNMVLLEPVVVVRDVVLILLGGLALVLPSLI